MNENIIDTSSVTANTANKIQNAEKLGGNVAGLIL